MTHALGRFLLANCHLKTHALIMDKNEKIDAFVSVQDSCGSQNPRIKQTMKRKSVFGINIFMVDG
jgi:hypothetical protein